jgi:uncharacterized protein
MPLSDQSRWEQQFERFVSSRAAADAAHDLEHIRRVVASASALAREEGADLAVVLPAAWLHDCVALPKDAPLRATASAQAARVAAEFLRAIGYPERHLPAIGHAIEAHSFSAGVAPRTIEAMVVRDADRLDALGAIGIARCMMLGGALGRRLYDPREPFPRARRPNDRDNTIDQFYAKLLRLAEGMSTASGTAEARRRTEFMEAFLAQLERELPL